MGVESGEQVESSLIFQGVVPQYRLEDLPNDKLEGGSAPWYTKSNVPLKEDFRHGCPPLVIGGSALGKGIFTDDQVLQSSEPYRVIRLAFQYGIRAIDTSPFYHPSEISLGRILKALSPEFPRNTYYLQTKVGRYGQKRKDFDYSPNQIRESVKTSLKRLNTDYLDSVVLHDVEFVCDEVGPSQKAGTYARDALTDVEVQKECGILIGDHITDDKEMIAAKKYGKGDEVIIAAAQTLFELKAQGIIRNVGIGGYPLPTLLRLSRLIACHYPFRAVDIIVNYSHHTLQNDLLSQYSVEFSREPRSARHRAAKSEDKIPDWIAPTIINASPFSMGLLTDQGPPPWHPASEELKGLCIEASTQLQKNGQSLAKTAAQFGFRGSELKRSNLSSSPSLNLVRSPFIPTIVGMNDIKQVHQAIQMFRAVSASTHFSEDERRQVAYPISDEEAEKYRSYVDQQKENERYVIDLLESKSLRNWTWASPPP